MEGLKVEVIFQGSSTGLLSKSKEWLDGVKAIACFLYPNSEEFKKNLTIERTTLGVKLIENPCTGRTFDFLTVDKLGTYNTPWNPAEKTWKEYFRSQGININSRKEYTIQVGTPTNGSIYAFESGTFLSGARDMLKWSGHRNELSNYLHHPHKNMETRLDNLIPDLQKTLQ